MNHSETLGALAAALAKARLSMGAIPKNKTANAGKFSYRYADLADVMEAVKQPLADKGLVLSQHVHGEANNIGIETVLLHESGEWMSSTISIPVVSQNGRMNAAQEVGTTITYLRRYSVTAMLGIASDDDTDASDAPAPPKPAVPDKKPDDSGKLVADVKNAVAAAKARGIDELVVEGYRRDAQEAWKKNNLDEVRRIVGELNGLQPETAPPETVPEEELF